MFVPGVWLTDFRDSSLVSSVCENEDQRSGQSRRSQDSCTRAKGAEKLVAGATLADFSGSLRCTARTEELVVLSNKSLQDLEQNVKDLGVASLTFQARCDVILEVGANK